MTNLNPKGPDDDLGTIHYAWLANNTRDWADFVHSFVCSCTVHRDHHVRHALALDGRHGLQAADAFFGDLRLRYISVVQKAQGPYHRPPYKDIPSIAPRMPPNELAFDRAVYDIFFGGIHTAQRPQQVAQQLQPHCDRLHSPCPRPSPPDSWTETPEERRATASLLASIEAVAGAVEEVARRVRRAWEEHGIHPASVSMVGYVSAANGDDDEDCDSDEDYHWIQLVDADHSF
ncbi:hypothetical protein HMPREF1624_05089 [Sporothrix schenckii ATCC 58251]|uniref:Uncharacterized protein n=1 Tax=Sporothrix schenckii (strain ATCC 58251 / de Perez 2211183) TaxID=1391915 RepID=U7PUZ1_SPOS1|nr:hypothetical protein HMPREF1624_05089 [Sporothrix schenckii ATCC 58251]